MLLLLLSKHLPTFEWSNKGTSKYLNGIIWFQKMEFKMEEFLQLFPNALTDFYDETKTVTDSYKEHALVR